MVATDSSIVEELISVLTVPLLVRSLWRSGFRRGDKDCETEEAFSLKTDVRRGR